MLKLDINESFFFFMSKEQLRKAGAEARAQKASEAKLLAARRDELRAQLAETKANIEKVSFDITQLQKELCAGDADRRAALEELKEKERKLVLLEEMNERVSLFTKLLSEYNRRLRSIISDIESRKTYVKIVYTLHIFLKRKYFCAVDLLQIWYHYKVKKTNSKSWNPIMWFVM